MCQPLLQELTKVEERIRAVAGVSLFLDFDGTLAPLAGDPEEAHLDEGTRKALARIASCERIVTTVISGRTLADLRSRTGLEELIYAGNHGLEIRGRGLHFVEPVADARREKLQQLSNQLAAELQGIKGVIVEPKGLTTTIHYRQAGEWDVAKIERVVRATLSPVAASFRVIAGKKVFEILPQTGWHKGRAVRWIGRHVGGGRQLSIYLGDDCSDEDAFRELPEGISVKVGNCTITAARYHLADPAAVEQFLIWLANHENA
jgi:trehalose-phosphatase